MMFSTNTKRGENESEFLYDFYCEHCKKYFSDDDVKKKRINVDNIGHSVLRFCPLCNAKDLTSVCLGCYDGLMTKLLVPDGGDYNDEGDVESFCNQCGEGYERFIVGFCQIMRKSNLSKRNIRRAIDKVFTHRGLPYNEKKRVEGIVFGTTITETNVVNVISTECQENKEFVRKQL